MLFFQDLVAQVLVHVSFFSKTRLSKFLLSKSWVVFLFSVCVFEGELGIMTRVNWYSQSLQSS